MEQLRELVTHAAEAFGRLSARDQKALLGGVVAAALLAAAVAAFSMTRAMNHREARTEGLRRGLAEILALRDTYRKAKGGREQFEERIKRNHMNLQVLVANAATRLGMQVTQTQDVSARNQSGEVKEVIIKVEFQRVTFPAVYDFAREMGNTSDLVYIRDAKVSRRFDNVDQVDAVLQVATLTSGP